MSNRKRRISPKGSHSSRDRQFGHSAADFLVDSPACVAQLILTRLLLFQGEYFLDLTEGTPWMQGVLGVGTKGVYDLVIQQRILATQGVTGIVNYSSLLTGSNRKLSVTVQVQTQYGQTPITVTL